MANTNLMKPFLVRPEGTDERGKPLPADINDLPQNRAPGINPDPHKTGPKLWDFPNAPALAYAAQFCGNPRDYSAPCREDGPYCEHLELESRLGFEYLQSLKAQLEEGRSLTPETLRGRLAAELQEQISPLQEQISQLQEQISQLQADCAAQISPLQAQISQLQAQGKGLAHENRIKANRLVKDFERTSADRIARLEGLIEIAERNPAAMAFMNPPRNGRLEDVRGAVVRVMQMVAPEMVPDLDPAWMGKEEPNVYDRDEFCDWYGRAGLYLSPEFQQKWWLGLRKLAAFVRLMEVTGAAGSSRALFGEYFVPPIDSESKNQAVYANEPLRRYIESLGLAPSDVWAAWAYPECLLNARTDTPAQRQSWREYQKIDAHENTRAWWTLRNTACVDYARIREWFQNNFVNPIDTEEEFYQKYGDQINPVYMILRTIISQAAELVFSEGNDDDWGGATRCCLNWSCRDIFVMEFLNGATREEVKFWANDDVSDSTIKVYESRIAQTLARDRVCGNVNNLRDILLYYVCERHA